MDVRSIILGFLMQKSMTGYELNKYFSISFSFFSGLSYGSIYPALRAMEGEGLITMRIEVGNGSPNRKVYTITESGKEAFLSSLRAPLLLDRQRNSSSCASSSSPPCHNRSASVWPQRTGIPSLPFATG